jgi:hypothetical protein
VSIECQRGFASLLRVPVSSLLLMQEYYRSSLRCSAHLTTSHAPAPDLWLIHNAGLACQRNRDSYLDGVICFKDTVSDALFDKIDGTAAF